jgi:hypothetical protein
MKAQRLLAEFRGVDQKRDELERKCRFVGITTGFSAQVVKMNDKSAGLLVSIRDSSGQTILNQVSLSGNFALNFGRWLCEMFDKESS